ncbi:hypothetical protein JVT61DRAFT_3912 [Boletus reticuloceps]|uniref:Uncharacterized protein n=1 Tax=Boletus reticuloceps TaxID=495285 RepID=A0A8I2YP39_9AGAM|nr:hypothetical protein JVT61DRAFT_3912 [Boletus reticuloceps]
MPRDKSIIALPDMHQSYLQMLYYYMGCRVEAAVRHLISLPADRWPHDWFDRLVTDNDWCVSLQSYHATRITSPLPVPAPQGALLENKSGAGILQQLLLQLDPAVFRMVDHIRGFLPDWNNSKRDKFEGAWWLGRPLEPSEYLSQECTPMVGSWAQRYFQNHWQETTSPIDEMHHHKLDAKEVSLLKKLQRYL